MNKVKYHINPNTGRPNKCTANVQSCKYAKDGQIPKHYDSTIEARAAYEEDMKQELFATHNNVNENNNLEQFKKYFSKNVPVMSNDDATKNVKKLYDEYAHIAKQELIENGEEDLIEKGLIINRIIEKYTFTDSRDWNAALRGHDVDEYYSNKYVNERKEELKKRSLQNAKNFNHLINKYGNSNTEPRKLYRYIKVPDNMSPEDYAETLIKDNSLTDKGFVSTTEDPGFIAAYTTQKRNRKNKYIMLEMLTTKGISVNVKEKQCSTLQSVEQERVLPTDTRFEILSKTTKRVTAGSDREELFDATFHSTGVNRNKTLFTLELVDSDLLK